MTIERHYQDGSIALRAHFPHAQDVYVLGDFNNWSTTATPLRRIGQGFFEGLVPLRKGPDMGKPSLSAEAEAAPAQAASTNFEPEIWFFVWERGQRIGRIVHEEIRILCSADPSAQL